jgi:hypothetical protein
LLVVLEGPQGAGRHRAESGILVLWAQGGGVQGMHLNQQHALAELLDILGIGSAVLNATADEGSHRIHQGLQWMSEDMEKTVQQRHGVLLSLGRHSLDMSRIE